jgi:hypothetical protein
VRAPVAPCVRAQHTAISVITGQRTIQRRYRALAKRAAHPQLIF